MDIWKYEIFASAKNMESRMPLVLSSKMYFSIYKDIRQKEIQRSS